MWIRDCLFSMLELVRRPILPFALQKWLGIWVSSLQLTTREYASRIKEAIADSGFSETISFILADLRCIPIRDCALDAAVSLHAVENMYGNAHDVERVVREYIRESARIVRSGGRVVVGTGYPVPRSKSQRTFIELRLFESKIEYFLWGSRAGNSLSMSWSLGLRRRDWRMWKQGSLITTFRIQEMSESTVMKRSPDA